jgi:internalin A
VTDAGLKELLQLKKLTWVDVPELAFTDAGLRHLVGAGLLHTLARASGKDGERPSSEAEVRSLILSGTKVTDAGLKELRPFQHLHRLNLSHTEVTDAGLKEVVGQFKQLQTLELSETKVTDDGLKELCELKQLTRLELPNSALTDAGLHYLASAGLLHVLSEARGIYERASSEAEVRSLSLRGTKVTNAGLKELNRLKNLQHLDLGSSEVTEAGVAELQRALPRCTIIR